MHQIQDLFISEDIFPVFDHTLNDDSKTLLKKILLTPLSSIVEINKRQEILKSLLQQDKILFELQYRKVDYLEAQRFLLHFSEDELKKIDYLTYLFQKKKNDHIFGQYAQLIYFFKDIEDTVKENLVVNKFPKEYQEDLQFILNYLASFKLTELKNKISKQQFGFKSIQLLNELVIEKRKNGDSLLFYDKFNLLEAYISICKAIPKLNLTFIEVGNSQFVLNDLFHPLISDAVKNDLTIEKNTVLLTGANMSGKSTFLKTIGLCVYLAHLGLPIPVHSGCMPFYDYIFVQINHSDDMKNGYSHFMNEIMNLRLVAEQAKNNKRCFAVFDELFKGTNHEDALAISQKTIQGLQQIETSLFIISTHLNELRPVIQDESVQALFIDCAIKDEMPVFFYKLKEGWSDLKIGQLLFKKIGLDDLFK